MPFQTCNSMPQSSNQQPCSIEVQLFHSEEINQVADPLANLGQEIEWRFVCLILLLQFETSKCSNVRRGCKPRRTGYYWRRSKPCQIDHLEQASSIECHFIESGINFFQCDKVSMLAECLEKWEKDDDAELVIIKASIITSLNFRIMELLL
ncbi:hypothetical protein HHK36_023402 [Tetracentron sinense]|uniref:Uncharacterized protein n=1 Tax=Tetracentron sinense TaxID=13715 RepID=A0A834YSA8_TETSI|nr:hypothetical protein HHK36_023402 [Tetracentron sinense]